MRVEGVIFVNQNTIAVCVRNLTLSGPAFSVVRQAQGELRGPDAKNQSYHQLIEIKLCMGHYIYKSIPDAKFEVDSSFSFGNMT